MTDDGDNEITVSVTHPIITFSVDKEKLGGIVLRVNDRKWSVKEIEDDFFNAVSKSSEDGDKIDVSLYLEDIYYIPQPGIMMFISTFREKV
jgi:hypothetical protein